MLYSMQVQVEYRTRPLFKQYLYCNCIYFITLLFDATNQQWVQINPSITWGQCFAPHLTPSAAGQLTPINHLTHGHTHIALFMIHLYTGRKTVLFFLLYTLRWADFGLFCYFLNLISGASLSFLCRYF